MGTGQEQERIGGIHERQQKGAGATQPDRTREPHQEGQGRVQGQGRDWGQGGREGSKDSGGNREPDRGGECVRMGGCENTGEGLATLPRRHQLPGQPLLTRHQVGVASRSPAGLSAWKDWEPPRGIRGGRGWKRATQTQRQSNRKPM